MEYHKYEESIASKLNPTFDANLSFYARKDGREYMLGLNLVNESKLTLDVIIFCENKEELTWFPFSISFHVSADEAEEVDASSPIPLDDGLPIDFGAIEVVQCLIEHHNAIFTDANETIWRGLEWVIYHVRTNSLGWTWILTNKMLIWRKKKNSWRMYRGWL